MIKINRPNCPYPKALIMKNGAKYRENKSALKEANHGKCMYCESKISHTQHGDIEHIKPKSKFPELEFDWDNLGYACATCNNFKRDKFNEIEPYINPYKEDPEKHISSAGALMKDETKRGVNTIRDIGLNRPHLLEKRGELINEMERVLNVVNDSLIKSEIINIFKEKTGNDKEYSLCVKNFLQACETIHQ